jgi:hypothetical protein
VLAGLRHDDPFVRDECAHAVVRAIEANSAALSAIHQLDARQLVDLVRSQAGNHAADAAARLYRAARDPRLKSTLSLVIAAIRRVIG